jgi:hypothetical protein
MFWSWASNLKALGSDWAKRIDNFKRSGEKVEVYWCQT